MMDIIEKLLDDDEFEIVEDRKREEARGLFLVLNARPKYARDLAVMQQLLKSDVDNF